MAQKGDSQMDIQTLKYFLCIADCQGITAAARKLNMTQPPLSNQLKALERELGFPLFVREKKKFILTAEGQILYQYAKNLSSEFDEMTEIFENMRHGITGTLNIGCISTPGVLILPDLIKKFRSKYRGVQMQLFQKDSYSLLEMLDSGQIDLAIMKAPKNLEDYQYLYTDSLLSPWNEHSMFVVALPHYFQGIPEDDSVALKDIVHLPLILHDFQKAPFLELCRRQGYEPNILGTNANVLASLLWCQEDLGAAILSNVGYRVIRHINPASALTAKQLKEYAGPLVHDVLIWRKDQQTSSIALKFIQEIRAMICLAEATSSK